MRSKAATRRGTREDKNSRQLRRALTAVKRELATKKTQLQCSNNHRGRDSNTQDEAIEEPGAV